MTYRFGAIIALAAQAYAAQNTLADCKATAALFDNTCGSTSTPIDFDSHNGKTMTCKGTMSCPGTEREDAQTTYTSSNPCQYQRKLCVTCSEVGGEVFIRVQTNGMPNHCFNGLLNAPSEKESDFTVQYNPQVDVNVQTYSESDVNSVEKTSELLCDLQRTMSENMPSTSNYVTNIAKLPRNLQPEGRDGPPPCHPNCPPKEDGMGPSMGGQGGGQKGGSGGQSGGGSMGPRSTDPNSTASGVYISGGWLFNALDGNNLDAYEQEARTLD